MVFQISVNTNSGSSVGFGGIKLCSMGFYARYILPHIIDLAMRNKETARLRAAWIPHARGDVLEIGIGSGLN